MSSRGVVDHQLIENKTYTTDYYNSVAMDGAFTAPPTGMTALEPHEYHENQKKIDHMYAPTEHQLPISPEKILVFLGTAALLYMLINGYINRPI